MKMDKRELTGLWFLKKRAFGGFDVLVQVRLQIWDDSSFGNGGDGYSPEKTEYQKARQEDLLELRIGCF